MKTFIISSVAEEVITAKNWLIPGTTYGVKPAVADGATVGLAETSVGVDDNIGVVKQGLVKVTAVAGAYKFGDVVELDGTGQAVAAGSSNPVGTVAEDIDLGLDPGEILIYLNVA